MTILILIFVAYALYLGFQDVMKTKKANFIMDMEDILYIHPEIKKSIFEYLEVANHNSIRYGKTQLHFPENLWEQGYRKANRVIDDLPKLIARERNIETELIIDTLP